MGLASLVGHEKLACKVQCIKLNLQAGLVGLTSLAILSGKAGIA